MLDSPQGQAVSLGMVVPTNEELMIAHHAAALAGV